jgi:hypothetical protein
MVSPRTRGIRGRGTLLKKKAVKGLGAGLITLICTLFTIGLTLEGLAISTLLSAPFNVLSLIGLTLGSAAIIAAIGLWREGTRLQNYWKRKRKLRPNWLEKKDKNDQEIKMKKEIKKKKEKKDKKKKGKKEKKKGNKKKK